MALMDFAQWAGGTGKRRQTKLKPVTYRPQVQAPITEVPEEEMVKPDAPVPSSMPEDPGMKPEPRKAGIFSNFFKGKTTPGGTDELGVSLPEKKEESGFKKLLDYALPALTGMSGGVGILPGVASAYAAKRGSENEASQNAQNEYLKRRAEAVRLREPSSDIKSFMEYSRMTPEKQAAYREMKMAMNPFAVERLDLQKQEAQDRKTQRYDDKLDKYVEKLKNSITDSQAAATSLAEVKKELGFDYNDYDPETAKVGGVKKDLPGFNIPGIGRVTALSGKARDISGALNRVFNKELKSRSGSAVVQHEFDRLKTEFQEGKFNTETEMIKGLQRYERALAEDMKNLESGYSPDVLSEYESRGGSTSRTLFKGSNKESGPTPAEAMEELARRRNK